MASHNIALGVPMHANKALLSDVLRDRFGLGDGGYIGSDADNVYQLSEVASGGGSGGYGIATGAADATQLWMSAGGELCLYRTCCSTMGILFCDCSVAGRLSLAVLLGRRPGHARCLWWIRSTGGLKCLRRPV